MARPRRLSRRRERLMQGPTSPRRRPAAAALPRARWARPTRLCGLQVRRQSFQDVGRLLLSAEVLAPATARAVRIQKRDILRDERVPEYWIVDADARAFDRWTPEDARPKVLSTTITWQPDEHVPPLVIELPRFFADALD